MHGHHLRDLRLDGKKHEDGYFRIEREWKGVKWIRLAQDKVK